MTRAGKVLTNANRPGVACGAQRCLILLLLMLGWSVGVMAMDSDDYLQEAQTYIQKGQDKHAVIQLKNALLLDKNNVEARLLLGQLYFDLEDIYSAEKELSRAYVLGADREEVLVPLGKIWLGLGQEDKVIEEISVAEEDSIPLRINIQLLLGKAYLLAQDYDKADERFSEALALEPALAEAFLGKASIAIHDRDIEKTLELVNKAIAIDPENADAWAMRGGQLRLSGNMEEAVIAYDRALAIEPDRTNTRLAKALALIGFGEYDKAQAEIDQIREKDRDYYMVHFANAMMFHEQQQLEQAQESLRRVLGRAPDYSPAHLVSGVIFYQQKQYNQAEQHLEKYRASVRSNAQADMLHAAIFMKLNEPGKAIEVLEPGVSVAGEDAQYLVLLGSAYMADGQSEKGLEYLQRASAIQPDATAIQAQLAIGLLAQGNADEGVAELQRVVDLGGDLLQAEVYLVIGYLQQEDFEKAAAAADALTRKLPDNPVPYNLRGLAEVNLDQPDAARKSFEMAVELRPEFTHAYLNLAQLDLTVGDTAAAKLRYLQILEFEEGNMQALFPLATLAEKEGRPREAEQWLKQARNYHPELMEPAVLLIELYERQGDITQALDLAEVISATHPRDRRVLLTLARVQAAAGKEQEAADTLRRLIELAPESTRAHTLLAIVLMKQNQNDAARSSLEKVLELQPDSPAAQVMLGQLDIKARNYSSALARSDALRKSHPDAAFGYELSGDVYAAKAAYKQAADAYAQAYDKAPAALLARKLFQAHQNNGEFQAAQRVLEQWLAKQPDDVAVRSLLAGGLQRQGKNTQAIEQYLYILERNPDDVSALNNIAWLYQLEGSADGVKYAERAHSLAPGRPEVTDTLGWLLIQNGNINRGLVLLQEAAVKAPHIAEIRYHMAVALAMAGRHDEARKVLDRLLKPGKGFQGIDEAKKLRAQLG